MEGERGAPEATADSSAAESQLRTNNSRVKSYRTLYQDVNVVADIVAIIEGLPSLLFGWRNSTGPCMVAFNCTSGGERC